MKASPFSPLMKMFFLLCLIVIGVSLVRPVQALQRPSVHGAQRLTIAPNDDFDAATDITLIPYRLTLDSFEATTALDDPVSTICGGGQPADLLYTVWYKYTPAVDTLVHMDTIGSNYDTYMVVWTGTFGSLTEVACNDDTSTTEFGSSIDMMMTAGVTYYIEVAQFNNYNDYLETSTVVSAKPIEVVEASTNVHVFRLVPLLTRTFRGNAAYDGFVVESAENSNIGLIKDSVLPYLKVGDDDKKRQNISILSFDTSSLPDGAMVRLIQIKLKLDRIVGQSNIFTAFNGLRVDIRTPYFGTDLRLESADFQAGASQPWAGRFGSTPVSGWYIAKLGITSFPYVNLTGFTQFRLHFFKDDDNDSVADYVRFHSGNSVTTNRPILVIRYYLP